MNNVFEIFILFWRRPIKALVRRVDGMEQVFNKRGRGRPRKTWWETLRFDINYMGLTDYKAID